MVRSRGQIRIVDSEGLEERACQRYHVIRDYLSNYEALDSVHIA